MSLETGKPAWNELHFLSWREFRNSAPAILRLEVERLSGIIHDGPIETDLHNRLVQARFELNRFLAALDRPEPPPRDGSAPDHLGDAIMILACGPGAADPEIEKARRYVIDRLEYVHSRLGYLY